jgi:hypothetical protein
LWQPKAFRKVSEEELRELKVGYRAKFLTRLSEDFACGTIDEIKLRALELKSARKELIKLYGVGPETARILSYAACHRAEGLQHIAPRQQKIYSRIFYNKPLVPTRKILIDLNRRYGQFELGNPLRLGRSVLATPAAAHIVAVERDKALRSGGKSLIPSDLRIWADFAWSRTECSREDTDGVGVASLANGTDGASEI